MTTEMNIGGIQFKLLTDPGEETEQLETKLRALPEETIQGTGNAGISLSRQARGLVVKIGKYPKPGYQIGVFNLPAGAEVTERDAQGRTQEFRYGGNTYFFESRTRY